MCREGTQLSIGRRGRALIGLVACLAALAAAAQEDTRRWPSLAADGIHDPRAPGLPLLQEPRDALRLLPPDTAGDQVRWVEALEKGVINPRTNIQPGTEVRLLDTDMYLGLYGSMPIVRFPHREHTLWLDCSNCHERLFISKAGANNIRKIRILQGEQCGQCHGAVAFPLTECARCHNTPRTPAGGPPVSQGQR